MKAMVILGVLLILLGIMILSYEWMNYRTAAGMLQSAEFIR
jgi:hypothetical protein